MHYVRLGVGSGDFLHPGIELFRGNGSVGKEGDGFCIMTAVLIPQPCLKFRKKSGKDGLKAKADLNIRRIQRSIRRVLPKLRAADSSR